MQYPRIGELDSSKQSINAEMLDFLDHGHSK